MLSIVHAAESQFRFESATRDRERALIASIRSRRAAALEAAAVETAVPAVSVAAEPRRVTARAARTAWARPIGVKTCEITACATA
ncbi:MAG TPA: hypothetical protein VNP97_04565 [Microbacterium sp.]|nr:hypothetical protein [Microbacterium sp.]